MKENRVISWFQLLRTRILIISMLGLGLMIGAVVTNSTRLIENAMIEYLRVSTKQTSEILNLAVAPYAVSEDFKTLKAFLDEFFSQENQQFGLAYLVVTQENGHILFKSGVLNEPIPEPEGPEAYPDILRLGMIHVRNPLLLKNNAVGFMQYGLSFNLMSSATDRIKREGILLAIAGVTLISVILIYIVLKIVDRLYLLGKVSEAIAQGNYQLRAAEEGRDEITVLAINFNKMADAIQQRVNLITSLNQDLEERVEARTHDLRELNHTLQQTIENLQWTQECLIRSEKLAGLGALVAGVAHEMNTPIGNALTVASTLQDHLQTVNEEFRGSLRRSTLEKFLGESTLACDLIVRNLLRTADLLTSFKHVAVDQSSENCREFDLRTTIEEIIATLSPMLKKTPYKLSLEIPANIRLNSYPGAMGQIVANLVNNALLHAFHERDHGNMTLRAALENQSVKIEFSDDGVGMSSQTLKCIFNPFFTTRLGLGGSGLGMSIVHNLACNVLQGSIDARSSPGKGACFTILIPLNVTKR